MKLKNVGMSVGSTVLYKYLRKRSATQPSAEKEIIMSELEIMALKSLIRNINHLKIKRDEAIHEVVVHPDLHPLFKQWDLKWRAACEELHNFLKPITDNRALRIVNEDLNTDAYQHPLSLSKACVEKKINTPSKSIEQQKFLYLSAQLNPNPNVDEVLQKIESQNNRIEYSETLIANFKQKNKTLKNSMVQSTDAQAPRALQEEISGNEAQIKKIAAELKEAQQDIYNIVQQTYDKVASSTTDEGPPSIVPPSRQARTTSCLIPTTSDMPAAGSGGGGWGWDIWAVLGGCLLVFTLFDKWKQSHTQKRLDDLDQIVNRLREKKNWTPPPPKKKPRPSPFEGQSS